MRKDPTAFKQRFEAYKNGKSVKEIYDAGLPKYEDGRKPLSYWDNKQSTAYDIPFIPEKQIKLTDAGLATGAVLSTNLLDSIADNAYTAGLPIEAALGLAVKESTLGNPTDDSSVRHILNSARYATFKELGTGQHIYKGDRALNGQEIINYHKGDNDFGIRYINTGDYKKAIESKNQSILQTGFEFYKENPDKYNPGQKNYQQLIDKRGKEVMQSPEVKKWYKEWEAKQVKVMRPKQYSLPTIQSTAPKKFGKYANGKLPGYKDGKRYLWDDQTQSWDRITDSDVANAMAEWAFTPTTTRAKFDYENTPNPVKPIQKNAVISQDNNAWTKQRVAEESNKRTWLSDAADVAHSIGEGAMLASTFAAPEFEPAITSAAKNLMWSNPSSLLSRNIRTSFFNRKSPFGYDWYDPNNVIPYINGTANTLIGRTIKPNPIPATVKGENGKLVFNNPAIKNRYAAWAKYLGVDDNLPLYDISSGESIGPYVANKDGSFSANLTHNQRSALVDDLISTGGKQLYDVALSSHGGMGFNVAIKDGKYSNIFPAELQYFDTWDLQPLKEIKWLPNSIRNFEASQALPAGAKPFTLKGTENIDHVDMQRLLRSIKTKPNFDKVQYNTQQNMAILYGLLGGGAITPPTFYGSKKLVGYLDKKLQQHKESKRKKILENLNNRDKE